VSPRKSTDEEVLSQVAESLMDKLAKEAYEVCMVSACIFANNWCIILQPLIKTLYKLKRQDGKCSGSIYV
jgi:hypothetical protein